MMSFFYFLFVTLMYGFTIASGAEPLCEAWTTIEKRLKDESFQISCLLTDDCYGFNCSGASHGYEVTSRILLNACENPPSVEFQISIPKLNINDFKKKIYHNDSMAITKNLHIEFEVERNNQNLMFGLFVHLLNNGSFPLLRVPMKIPVISNMAFPVHCELSEETTRHSVEVSKSISKASSPPTKSFLLSKEADFYSNCSIKNSTCSEEEMCQQIDKSKPDGICVCRWNYTRDETGNCVYNKTIDSSSGAVSICLSLLLTAILVPVFVVLILVAIVYIVIRFRVFQHLRRRLRVQVYEHVLLGEEEDEDLTNPVA